MAPKSNAPLPREAFKQFYGRNVDQMPRLLAGDRVPISVAGLMQRRLDGRNSDAYVNRSCLDNFFNTGDAVVYHRDGRVKIVLDSQTLRDITPKSKLRDGALVLTEEAYNALQGEEFKKGELGKVDGGLSREQAKAHPVWKVLARDQALLNDYVDYIFGEYQKRFGKDTPLDNLKLMGVSLYPLGNLNLMKVSKLMEVSPDSGRNEPRMRAWYIGMRAWYVSSLEYGSYADGRCDLDNDGGCFLGIALEALSALGEGASNIITYTMTGFTRI